MQVVAEQTSLHGAYGGSNVQVPNAGASRSIDARRGARGAHTDLSANA